MASLHPKYMHVIRIDRSSILGHSQSLSVFGFAKHYQATTIQCHILETKIVDIWYTSTKPDQFILRTQKVNANANTEVVPDTDHVLLATPKPAPVLLPRPNLHMSKACFVESVEAHDFIAEMLQKNIAVRLIEDIKELDASSFYLHSPRGFEPVMTSDGIKEHLETVWTQV